MNWFTGSERESLILLSWAFKHPYLYTFIRCANPSLYIVIILAGMRLITIRRNTREKGHYRTR